jgi:nitrite reductase/ring-hydroxylating ferredoxin subunit
MLIRPGAYPIAALPVGAGPGPFRVVVAGRPYALAALDGAWVVLSDRCPHRFAPLSGGSVVGPPGAEAVQCPYHGWRFDGSGRCTLVPSLPAGAGIPARAVSDEAGVATEAGGALWASFHATGSPPACVPALRAYEVELDVDRVLSWALRLALDGDRPGPGPEGLPTYVGWGRGRAALAVVPREAGRSTEFASFDPGPLGLDVYTMPLAGSDRP